jgi:cytochrome c-type biogenesis protein CcmE
MEGILQNQPAKSTTRSRNISWKFLIGSIVLVGVIVFVVFSSFQSNTVYYYTVPELQQQRAQLVGRTIRVNGALDKASIQNDQKNLVLHFNIVEADLVLPVVYRGVAPDTLGTGESVVAEGRLDPNGVFQANTILVKCPSKYEESSVGY